MSRVRRLPPQVLNRSRKSDPVWKSFDSRAEFGAMSWLRTRRVVARLGDSIFVFDMDRPAEAPFFR